MRVCMITPRYPPDRCGVGDYTALLSRHLAERGCAVTVVTSQALAPCLAPVAASSGVQVRPLIAGWGWSSLLRLCAVLMAGRYDLVHVQYQNEMYGRSASIAALPVALRLLRPRLPVVVTVHDYGTPWPRRLRVRAIAGPYGKAWFAALLLAARRVILTNEQDEWRFLRQSLRYPLPASRYATVPVGSNLPAVQQPRPRGDGPVTVGYFGFVNAAKGVDVLVDAFALAQRRRPSLRLIMLCALRDGDPYHRAMWRRIDEAGLGEVVTVSGELDDEAAATALAGVDLVALPFRDGISLRRTTLMAALSLGRAVVSTTAAAPPAALRDGCEVLLVPPSDPQALADALVALADDPERRAALGRHGAEAARQFAWPSIAERTEQVYREALA